MRAPDAPRGWPSAMAPPFKLVRAMSSLSACAHAMTCGANASLISTRSTLESSTPARSAAALMAGTGPMPILVGSTPTTAHDTSSASGLSPCCSTAASLATTSEAAPSQMPEAEPACTTPSFLKVAGSLLSFSSVVALGCSSTTKSTLPFLLFTCTGEISSAKAPAECAAAHRSCDESAYASDCARVMPKSDARFSAVIPIGQPACVSVSPDQRVSTIPRSLPRRVPQRMSCPYTAIGAWLIDSVPPASPASTSPSRISCATLTTA
mmetsp:Transcript_31721/g.73848  ORF Transcript_31721/g.73848 Transcript_31721/m.73848 type:complete len:266 (-) Transcript_31721:312-1109(-)